MGVIAAEATLVSGIHLLLLAGFSFLPCGVIAAEAPALEALFPSGGARGTTNAVATIGKFDPWPPKVWVSEPGVTFNAETNKGKFSVIIPHDAPAGPRLVRLYSEEGASEPRLFVVGDGKEVLEVEPNNHFAKAQPVSGLPVTINGRLDKNDDVDSFAIEMHSGQWLDARLDSYTLMSKVDAVLRLVTTNGGQLAWNHDFTTLDPRLVWQATNDQTVVLQIFGFAYPPSSDIRLTGGDALVYRLHLNHDAPHWCEPPTEKEPNNSFVEAEPVDLPAKIFARIGNAEDEDRFRFAASKGEFIAARVEAASLGSPLDAWMKIEDSGGNPLARSDDADGSPDPSLEWKVPTNGHYAVAIGSVTHRGGEDFCYRLTMRRVKPDFSATLAAGSLLLSPGSTNEIKFSIKRTGGHTNEVRADIRGLPPGVSVLETSLSPKESTGTSRPRRREAPPEQTIRLVVTTDAENFQGPVRLFLIDVETKEERRVPFELTTRGETGFNHLLIETCDQPWLTIRRKPAASTNAPTKK